MLLERFLCVIDKCVLGEDFVYIQGVPDSLFMVSYKIIIKKGIEFVAYFNLNGIEDPEE